MFVILKQYQMINIINVFIYDLLIAQGLMINQKKKKHLEIALEPWKVQQNQFDNILMDVGVSLSPESPVHSNLKNKPYIKIQSHIPKKTNFIPNNKIHQSTSQSLSMTPKNRTPSTDYIRQNQKRIQLYVRNTRKWSIHDTEEESSIFVPINGQPCKHLRKPIINITHIGYNQDYCNGLQQSVQFSRSKRKRNYTQYELSEQKKKFQRPSTGTPLKKQTIDTEFSKSEHYKTGSHLQKVLKIKEKLRQKTKKQMKQKEQKKVFMFSKQPPVKQEIQGRIKINIQHQRERKSSIRSLHIKTSIHKQQNSLKMTLPCNELSISGGSIFI